MRAASKCFVSPLRSGIKLFAWSCLLLNLTACSSLAQSPADAEATPSENPVPYSKESLDRGRKLYMVHCSQCHGADGRGLTAVVAQARDLTDPDLWSYGTSDAEIFRTISNGAGVGMPGFKTLIPDSSQLWDLVNFVRSLWPESKRPKVEAAGEG